MHGAILWTLGNECILLIQLLRCLSLTCMYRSVPAYLGWNSRTWARSFPWASRQVTFLLTTNTPFFSSSCFCWCWSAGAAAFLRLLFTGFWGMAYGDGSLLDELLLFLEADAACHCRLPLEGRCWGSSHGYCSCSCWVLELHSRRCTQWRGGCTSCTHYLQGLPPWSPPPCPSLQVGVQWRERESATNDGCFWYRQSAGIHLKRHQIFCGSHLPVLWLAWF